MRLFRRGGDAKARGWVRLQRPEHSERAAATGLRHRYRGALVMLTSAGPRVVMTQALASGDGEPVYGCVVPEGTRFSQPHPGPEPPQYLLARPDGSVEPRRKYRESQLVSPDEAALQRAVGGALAAGPSEASIVRLQSVLLDAYVWLTLPDPGPVGEQADLTLFRVLAQPAPAGDLADPADSKPLHVFSDLDRAEALNAAVGRRSVAARLPFVAACAIADRLGSSESIIIDQASDAPFTLPREWYLRFPEAVVGYDLAMRPFPPGGLDPAWLGPVASAVRAESTVISACAWSVAAGLPGPVEVLGLVVDPGLGPGGFDRARESVRGRAVAAGLVPRPYGVALLAPDDPHLTDAEHVTRLEAGGSTFQPSLAHSEAAEP